MEFSAVNFDFDWFNLTLLTGMAFAVFLSTFLPVYLLIRIVWASFPWFRLMFRG